MQMKTELLLPFKSLKNIWQNGKSYYLINEIELREKTQKGVKEKRKLQNILK